MVNLKQIFGLNVQKYRKLRKITQEKLAEIVGVDSTSISSIETGKYFVSADNLLKIANALNVEVSELFEMENVETAENLYNDIIFILESYKDDCTILKSIKNYLKSII
jgi:transcriptional regulator with XRE-family HTH domain